MTAQPENGLDVEAVNPAIHEKYSPNLYKWLKKQDKCTMEMVRVFTGVTGIWWIGYPTAGGDFHGHRLMQVLCKGRRVDVCCFCGKTDIKEVVGFWEEYTIKGRCAIDQGHEHYFLNAENRYTEIEDGNKRICHWCGQKQIKRMRRCVEYKTVWENVPRASGGKTRKG